MKPKLRHSTPANSNGDSPRPSPHGYPRPQMVRSNWTDLSGKWDFSMAAGDEYAAPDSIDFNRKITVPFAPETPASGIHHTGFIRTCWYRRSFEIPTPAGEERCILHFGAVDFCATVWVNGVIAARHEGGYTPFQADITDLLNPGAKNTLIVRADDDPLDMCKPRGKQDWLEQPHSIWYFRTTGIWQPVWLEMAPATRIAALKWTPNVERWEMGLDATIDGPIPDGAKLRVRLEARGTLLAEDEYLLGRGEVKRRIDLIDPGIGDAREFLLWWPHRPTLIAAHLALVTDGGEIIDRVESYTAMRSVAILRDRFMLNHAPYRLELVLNQGYWPDTGLTAPDDQAFQLDVKIIRELGFNGVRMHQKIENPRFLYWCDVLGLLVWEEMPSAYAYSHTTAQRVTREWAAAIERDVSHPCIVAWVPINESWCVPDLPLQANQRHFMQGLYHLTKSLDPTRPVIGNDGWEMLDTDIIAIHDYDKDPQRLANRYRQDPQWLERLFKEDRPGGRVLLLEGATWQGKPIMLTEFGGIAFSDDPQHTWGYSRANTGQEFQEHYETLMKAVRGITTLAGFCYTQFTDTYQEANGLLYMNRNPKYSKERIDLVKRPINAAERRGGKRPGSRK